MVNKYNISLQALRLSKDISKLNDQYCVEDWLDSHEGLLDWKISLNFHPKLLGYNRKSRPTSRSIHEAMDDARERFGHMFERLHD